MAFLKPTNVTAARAVSRAGAVCGVFLVIRSVLHGCVHGQDLLHDLLWALIFGAASLVLLALISRVANAFVVRQRLRAETEEGNVAAAVAAAAHYIAVGSILAHCLYGDDLTTLGLSFMLLIVALVTVLVLLTAFRSLTSYDDEKEIAAGNTAAALSYGGVAVAIAIIVGHAADSSFVMASISVRSYLGALLFCLALYPVRQLLVARGILRLPLAWRGGALDALIARDRSVGAAAAEALSYLATAFLVSGVV